MEKPIKSIIISRIKKIFKAHIVYSFLLFCQELLLTRQSRPGQNFSKVNTRRDNCQSKNNLYFFDVCFLSRGDPSTQVSSQCKRQGAQIGFSFFVFHFPSLIFFILFVGTRFHRSLPDEPVHSYAKETRGPDTSFFIFLLPSSILSSWSFRPSLNYFPCRKKKYTYIKSSDVYLA